MSINEPPTTIDDLLVIRLVAIIGIDRIERLLDHLEKLAGETGYGGVEIVVAEGRVTLLKVNESYR